MADRFYSQERRRTCVVASLRSVLASQYGAHVREDALRFAGDTAADPIVREGCNVAEMRRMLAVANRALNKGPRWRFCIHRRGRIRDLARELRAGRYPLVSVLRHDGELHMVVACGYRAANSRRRRGRARAPRVSEVKYFDPVTGRSRWVGSMAFRRLWRDEDGGVTWYAVVTGGRPIVGS